MRKPHFLSIQPVINFFVLSGPVQTAMARMEPWAALDWLDKTIVESGAMQRLGALDDGAGMRAIAMLKLFEQQGCPMFKIANDFGNVLLKADCKVSLDYLPFDNRIRCIEFPDDLSFDMKDGDWGRCAYVACFETSPDVDFLATNQRYRRRIDITVPLWQPGRDENCDGYLGEDNIRVFLHPYDTLEVAMKRAHQHIGRPTGFTNEIIEYVLKCLLYVNSGDPDLREFRPTPKPRGSPRQLRKWRKAARAEICEIPVTLVGFDYKKPREFTAGDVHVDTHLRWQPYGPGREKVRLIWVRAHVRHYGKEERA